MQTEQTKPGAADASGSQSRPGFADQAKDAARREMDDARERLSGAADKARAGASRAGRSVQNLMMDEIDKRKGVFCEGLEGVAQAMRKAADDLDENEDSPGAPLMVHQAVNTIEDFADRLKYQSAEDIGRNLSRYGRENPTLFIAGALLAGLAAGRFFIASGSGGRASDDEWDDDWDRSDREQSQGPLVLNRGPKGQTYGAARPSTSAYGTGRHEDLPSGTGKPSSPLASATDARNLSSGQGGLGTPGGLKAGSTSNPGTSNMGAGSGPAGVKKPGSTLAGDKDGTS